MFLSLIIIQRHMVTLDTNLQSPSNYTKYVNLDNILKEAKSFVSTGYARLKKSIVVSRDREKACKHFILYFNSVNYFFFVNKNFQRNFEE